MVVLTDGVTCQQCDAETCSGCQSTTVEDKVPTWSLRSSEQDPYLRVDLDSAWSGYLHDARSLPPSLRCTRDDGIASVTIVTARSVGALKTMMRGWSVLIRTSFPLATARAVFATYKQNKLRRDRPWVQATSKCNNLIQENILKERYPQRQCPDRKTFVRLHYRLCEYGKFNSPGLGRGRPRSTTPEVQEEILEAVNMTPSISTRRVALQVNVPHTTVWRLLKEYQLYPYHLQRVQALSPADYPARVRFCQWFLQQCGVNPELSCLSIIYR
ncbi:hypothetical protein ANN_01100 [Periplaneta americana]|uniref:Transposase Tc1-like domain-containing protein n=1 Tax=Periplaneta americana TaxID=6978 RepID=A0ABQ8TSM1_PERAM|nr:hypothetical protein ANN_01100 [Periplaneta americana]